MSLNVSRHKLILYIEDNSANLYLVEQIIARATDHALISASNATLGLDLAVTRKPDLILMDINLPGMDGYAAMRVLKSSAVTRHIPVIAVSAGAMKTDIEKGEAADFVAYVTKPIEISTLISTIDKFINTAN